MSGPIEAVDLGRVPYRKALALQRGAVEARALGEIADRIYFVEHDPVITVGRAGRPESFRVPPAELERRGVEVVAVERGGDATYHGPGQLVAYPIVSLAALPGGRDVHRYLRDLEEVVLRALRAFGLEGSRMPPHTGVWVGDSKVAAIGVAVRRWVTFHGLALNVDPDLRSFDLIHPCGIRDRGVASLRSLLGTAPARDEVLARLAAAFQDVWQRPLAWAPTRNAVDAWAAAGATVRA